MRYGGPAGPDHFTNIPPGSLTNQHMADFCPYPNTLQILRINGAQLRAWLEYSASIFNPLVPDTPDALLISMDAPAYHFDVINGVTYMIDLGTTPPNNPINEYPNSPPHRIKSLHYNSAEISDQHMFYVATNNYRAMGGGGFPNMDGSNIVINTTELTRKIVTDYVRHSGDQLTFDPMPWGFSSQTATQVQFATGRGAASQFDNLPLSFQQKLRQIGENDDGFEIFEFDLS